MKLLNHTSSYFAGILLVVMAVWAGIFYYAMLDEIYDSIDDGLDNQKGLIIRKAAGDTSVLHKSELGESGYEIREIQPPCAVAFHDVYSDTAMYMENEKDYEPVRLLRTVFVQGGKYYRLDVATSMVEEDDLVSELLYALLWLYLGLVASVVIVNNFLLRRIWRPFYNLLQQLRGFRLEKATPISTPQTRVQEFQELNQTVGKLLQSNIDSYTSQKHFIENAAHELQTPLAITAAKLETLAERGNLSEEEGALLSSAIDHVQRMARLNRSLLLLSKIENRQFAEEKTVSINHLVAQVLEDFKDGMEYRELTLHFSEEENLVVNMNEDLARILTTNLIKNAVVHNRPGGEIWVMVRAKELLVGNTGADASLKNSRLFTRFSRGESTANSTGLGLAIVKAIADLYGFRIAYAFDKGRHTMTMHF